MGRLRWSVGLIPLLTAVALAGLAPADADARARKARLDLQLERTPVIVRNAYRRLPPIGKRGGMGLNFRRSGFSLAHQQLGDLYVRAGIIQRKPRLIRHGFRAFDYGFRRQRGDGSFPEDQVEGYAFFLEAVAHSALLVRKSRYEKRFRGKLRSYRKRLAWAAPHMVAPVAFAAFKGRNPHYTHSGYSVGTALALTGKLVGSGRLKRFGRYAIAAALDNQRRNGVNPELGGPDVRYQMVGISYAQRYHVYFPGGRLGRPVKRMIIRGLRWMSRQVDRDGYIRWRRSTRACHELSSTGNLKTPGYGFAVRGFAYWGALRGRAAYLREARMINRYERRVGGASLCGPKVERGPRKQKPPEERGGGGGGGEQGLLDRLLPPNRVNDLLE